jgi:hypothetical protein
MVRRASELVDAHRREVARPDRVGGDRPRFG